ncbi:MAG TPA: hypothetical protein VHM19_15985, partial [Polyangiales bacterium]|nr:hypothetical protein [Polyangiales bacterium]
GRIDMVINTTSGEKAIKDSYSIRRQTLLAGVSYYTTMAAAAAAAAAIEDAREHPVATGEPVRVCSLQEYHSLLAKRLERRGATLPR